MYILAKKLNNEKKNVIWGAGADGKSLLFDLMFQGVYIDFFCDSDEKKQHVKLFNKEVLSPAEILKNSEKYNLIIATSIEQNIIEIKKDLEGYDGFIVWENDVIRGVVNLGYIGGLYSIIQRSDRKIIIYGKDRKAAEIKHILEYLDIEISYFIDEIKLDEENYFCGKPIKSIYSLLDEEKEYLVILPMMDRLKGRQLEQLGLVCGKNFIVWGRDGYQNEFREWILDSNLGYNFESNNQLMPGIFIYGHSNAKLKIVTLGGSTTDSEMFPFRSWPEFLADKLIKQGHDCCVICAGASAYRSSQELVKLVRDIVPMRPNIIIDFTGANDAKSLDDYHFVSHLQRNLFQSIMEQADTNGEGLITNKKVILGVKNDLSPWEEFEKNIRCMKAICEEHKIRYYAFLQPCLALKSLANILNKSERELIVNIDCNSDDLEKKVKSFYSNKGSIADYMIDLTNIFDNYNVYLDRVHVTEEGNNIIADKIIMEIEKKGENWK